MSRIIEQMPSFKKVYKKLQIQKKAEVNQAIKKVVSDPEIGEETKGDLKGVCVYKFKIQRQEFLLGYQYSRFEILLLALGVHENFYRDLKR